MKRKVSEFSTFISKAKLRRLLAEGSFGQVVIEKVGEEHDGQQVVIRFTVRRQAQNAVEMNVKEFVWDHGGCMVGEEGRR